MAQTRFPIGIFNDTQRYNPQWSSFTCFIETIKGKKYFKTPTIRKYFDILVDKDDYGKKDKGEILGFLYRATKE